MNSLKESQNKSYTDLSKIKKDIYGSWVVDSANSIELEGNTIEELKTSFNTRFKIAV